MDKNRLNELAANPNHITGIYNYCDRWCERCTFTSRCLLYAMEKEDEQNNDPETLDLENEKFWNKIHESFQLTLELLRDDADKLGIDLDNLPDDPELIQKHEDQMEAARNHPLTKKADRYFQLVYDWMDENNTLFENKASELQRHLELGMADEDPEKDAGRINDAVDVIQWYLMQIEVKLSRAFNSRFFENEEREYEDFDDLISDADGSAKVSLIGIDRSIAAWGIMLQHFSEVENKILDFLVILEQLRKGIEKEFPEARNFKRPGFDD